MNPETAENDILNILTSKDMEDPLGSRYVFYE